MGEKEGPIDLTVLGAELRAFRHSRGMSVVAFAFELGKPAWLIDVLEHAEDELSARLCTLLPAQEILAVQEELHRQQRTSAHAPKAAAGDPNREASGSALLDEQTFYFPVTISADCAMDIIDQLLPFVTAAAEQDARRQQFLQQHIASAGLMFNLLGVHHRQNGHTELAQYSLQRFKGKLQEHMQVCS